MTFPKLVNNCVATDSTIEQELIAAGIQPVRDEGFRLLHAEVMTSVRGFNARWGFVRGENYWLARGPGIDVESAEVLFAARGNAVRVNGYFPSQSPREVNKGLGCDCYHVHSPEGLKALSDLIKSIMDANAPSPSLAFAEGNSIGEEIERKFLVKDESWRALVEHSSSLRQGYLNSNPARTVRVRIQDGRGVQTIKGLSDDAGVKRPEMNKKLTIEEAEFMLDICEPGIIDKTRHFIHFEGRLFEVDEFHGENGGLILAEISFKQEGEVFERPAWLGEEVTGRPEYYNSSLSKRPYTAWGAKA